MTLHNALAEISRQASTAKHAHTAVWVASTLRQQIAAGNLQPGVKLSEQSLGEALGVSRNTLREAFAALDAERILTRLPNRGVFVADPSADDIREIYRVRRFIEPSVLLWSDDADLGEMHRIVAAAWDARAAGSVAEMGNLNQRFHSRLVALARSERLNATMEQVLAEMRLVFHALAGRADFHANYVEQNAAMLGLLEDGRRAEAAEAMRRYLDQAEAELLAAKNGM